MGLKTQFLRDRAPDGHRTHLEFLRDSLDGWYTEFSRYFTLTRFQQSSNTERQPEWRVPRRVSRKG